MASHGTLANFTSTRKALVLAEDMSWADCLNTGALEPSSVLGHGGIPWVAPKWTQSVVSWEVAKFDLQSTDLCNAPEKL